MEEPIQIVSSATPWHESNWIWGPSAAALGLIVTAVASVKHDLRPLLFLAGLFIVMTAFALSKRTKQPKLITVLVAIIVVLAIAYSWMWLRPDTAKPTGVTASTQSQETTPLRIPPASAPSLPIQEKETERYASHNRSTHGGPHATTPPEIDIPTTGPGTDRPNMVCTGSNCIAGNNYGNPTVVNAPRDLSLSSGDWVFVASAMRPYAGTKVQVNSRGLSSSTVALAKGLRGALSSAGLEIDANGADAYMYVGVSGPASPGFSFVFSDDNYDALDKLTKALASVGGLIEGQNTFPATRVPGNHVLEVIIGATKP